MASVIALLFAFITFGSALESCDPSTIQRVTLAMNGAENPVYVEVDSVRESVIVREFSQNKFGLWNTPKGTQLVGIGVVETLEDEALWMSFGVLAYGDRRFILLFADNVFLSPVMLQPCGLYELSTQSGGVS